ncbi:MAG: hypothetical protein KDD01_23975 [Phaeodactylibacter sp.]|nr:hypothetical protein [Phaeodactylibacter sp.]
MYPSCEVRWFFPAAPEGLIDWFVSKNRRFDTPASAKRTDHYLLVPNGENIGIKLREGNIETKHLVKRQGERHFPELGATGVVEHWIKWSFKLDEADSLSQSIIHDGQDGWIAVEKERLGFTYHFLEDGAISEVSIYEWVPEGCQVELTRIVVENKTFHTFGLEAFSSSGQMERNLEQGAGMVFLALQRWCAASGQPIAGLGFPKSQSVSYPAFLLEL